jgi:type IV pilus biogenesis protein CpaD/CtpE
MEPTNLTIEILKSIRDEVKGVRDEVRVTNERVDALGREMRGSLAGLRGEARDGIAGLSERIDAVREQQVHTEMRLATELIASTAEFRALRDELRKTGFARARLDDHEMRIEALEKRTG